MSVEPTLVIQLVSCGALTERNPTSVIRPGFTPPFEGRVVRSDGVIAVGVEGT